MGIAVSVIYIPIFIICTIVAIWTGRKISDFDSPFEKTTYSGLLQIFALLFGMGSSMIICIIAMWFIPIKNNPSWDGFIENLAITLLGPLAIGIFVFFISLIFGEKLKAILRLYSTGALFSVPFFPAVAFMVFRAVNGT